MIRKIQDRQQLDRYLASIRTEMTECGESPTQIDTVLESLREQVEETVNAEGVSYAAALAALDPPDSFRTPVPDASLGTVEKTGTRVEHSFGLAGLLIGAGAVIFGQLVAATATETPQRDIGDVITLIGVIIAISTGALNLHTRAGKAAITFGAILLTFIILAIYAEQG